MPYPFQFSSLYADGELATFYADGNNNNGRANGAICDNKTQHTVTGRVQLTNGDWLPATGVAQFPPGVTQVPFPANLVTLQVITDPDDGEVREQLVGVKQFQFGIVY